MYAYLCACYCQLNILCVLLLFFFFRFSTLYLLILNSFSVFFFIISVHSTIRYRWALVERYVELSTVDSQMLSFDWHKLSITVPIFEKMRISTHIKKKSLPISWRYKRIQFILFSSHPLINYKKIKRQKWMKTDWMILIFSNHYFIIICILQNNCNNCRLDIDDIKTQVDRLCFESLPSHPVRIIAIHIICK